MALNIFVELSIILFITIIVSFVMRILNQPYLIGYIISGIIAGPFLLNVIVSTSVFATFSHIGVALLLFFVGINLNPKAIKDVGKISLITGIGQVLFTTGIGYLICVFLGFSFIEAIYISIALAFSSTIIIMKLLSDKKELETVHGKISIGFLIVQDLIAILILLFISSSKSGIGLTDIIMQVLIGGVLAIAGLFIITFYVLPGLTKIVAESQELLLLFSISWCFIIATVFYYLNFSIEAGALIAGATLSLSPYSLEISHKLKPLRDFFLILFFILLGSQIIFSNILTNLHVILILSAFVLFGNPIIVMALMGFFGHSKRNGFLAGLTVAQISEFSLIVVSMGIAANHISASDLSLVTTVGLITFAGSTYMILNSEKLYNYLSGYISIFERKCINKEKNDKLDKNYDILLVGYDRIGHDILSLIKKQEKKYLIIDYNPETIKKLTEKKYNCIYGDIEDIELLNEIDFSKIKIIISSVPNYSTNLLLIQKAIKQNKDIAIITFTQKLEEALKLYLAGASYIIIPRLIEGNYLSEILEKNNYNNKNITELKKAQIKKIKNRINLKEDISWIYNL